MPDIYLYNTLHRRKETFIPLDPPQVGFYSCGPTVYHFAHIGNLRSYVFADTLKRMLAYNGYDVIHIMNITDVGHLTDDADQGEDKMEKGAKRENKTVWEVAEFYTQSFMNDIKRLNIQSPTKFTKATDHIAEQITLIKELEEKGFTYKIDDGIYFDTSKFPTYGQLGLLNLEEQKTGARVAANDQKRNGADFALWKFSPQNEKRAMEWESPWGVGFPGWHIECSAMAMTYLGQTFDIHTGGIDHITVHHTNEIAQSEAATGKPFVRFWMHNEFLVNTGGEKLSKSTGNFLTLQSLIDQGYDALDYRFMCLNAHYRTPLTFTELALDAAKHGRERINQFARRIFDLRDTSMEHSNDKYLFDKQQAIVEAISDDLNTPMALGIIFDVIKDLNTQIDNKTLAIRPAAVWGWLIDIDRLLGLNVMAIGAPKKELPDAVQELLAKRQLAREQKDFAQSDKLRDLIREMGYVVEDTGKGQVIKEV